MPSERKIALEIFNRLERQGPGDEDCTRKALHMIPSLPTNSRVLDIGCGTGGQTLTLAEELAGSITALDYMPEHLETLKRKMAGRKLRASIVTQTGSMFDMDFSKESFDLIWSEGAIYIIGFRRGLHEWQHLVKAGGYMVVSHLSWLADKVPRTLRDFWMNDTEVLTVRENVNVIQSEGLKPLSHFPMSSKGWWENYYMPIQRLIEQIRKDELTDGEKEDI